MTDNEIIKALECCHTDVYQCEECPIKTACYSLDVSLDSLALDLINRQKEEIKKLQDLVDEMMGFFPACIGCEGKTEIGERTDKCVYMLGDTTYCVKRGIENIYRIMKENELLKSDHLKDQT